MGDDFDLQAWVKDLDLSDDDRKVLEPMLARETVQKKFKDSFLRQSDYSRKMNELAAQQKDLESKIQQRMSELDAHEQGLVSWKGVADKTLSEREEEIKRLSAQLDRNQAAMSKIQQEFGIDASQYGVDTPAVPQSKGFDESVLKGYVDRDSFQKAVNDTMQFPSVAAELIDLNAEHQELFGKSLRNNRQLVEEALKQKKPLREVWAQQYKTEDRRQELAKKAHDEEIERVRKETEMKVRSELKVPAQRPNAARPMILSDNLKRAEGNGAGHRSTLDAAMAAYSSGKYAEQ